MVFIVKTLRLAAFLLWSLLLVAFSLPNRLRGWRGRKATGELVRIWAKGIAVISGLSIKTYGNLPPDIYGLVVSNHLGYLDIVVHASLFPLRFTPSTDVAKIPFVGMITAMSNAIFLDRSSVTASRKASRDFVKTMRRGMFLIVYPEGTSTDGRHGILPFKSTPFDAASYGKMPILPILTRYNEISTQPEIPWYGDMTFFPHFWKLLGSRSINAEVLFLDPISPGDLDRKELAVFVHKVMLDKWDEWSHPPRGV